MLKSLKSWCNSARLEYRRNSGITKARARIDEHICRHIDAMLSKHPNTRHTPSKIWIWNDTKLPENITAPEAFNQLMQILDDDKTRKIEIIEDTTKKIRSLTGRSSASDTSAESIQQGSL